jgi:hypothetical protein
MKKRPSLVLREPVKLYEPKEDEEIITKLDEKFDVNEENPLPKNLETILKEKLVTPFESELLLEARIQKSESIRQKMSPRIQQIWDYFCKKARDGNQINKSFSLTRAEVMKEANIGSTNTYRDALKKFRELNLLEVELRPGVNAGSIFTLTDQGVEEVNIKF